MFTLEKKLSQIDKRLTYHEKIPAIIYDDNSEASIAVAREITNLIAGREKKNRKTVLGLATGSTPVGVYKELVRIHREEGISFKNVITFNLDEYYPIDPDSLQSFSRFMNEHLFDHIDIPREQIYIPDGTIPEEKIEKYCEDYEQKIEDAGGIDIQLLGIGKTGHIGFNEPGSRPDSPTRL
ncbi:MAG: 6-phosphogluconolactonase, partial [Balneolaceae bacterium]